MGSDGPRFEKPIEADQNTRCAVGAIGDKAFHAETAALDLSGTARTKSVGRGDTSPLHRAMPIYLPRRSASFTTASSLTVSTTRLSILHCNLSCRCPLLRLLGTALHAMRAKHTYRQTPPANRALRAELGMVAYGKNTSLSRRASMIDPPREYCKLQDRERLFHLGKALVHLGEALTHLGLQLRTQLPYIRLRGEILRLRNLGSRSFGLVLWNVR